MKNWSRRHTLISGMALILITNAVALLGVAWNRSGEAESTLQLTQRELQQPYWGANRESSGIALGMNWRVPAGDKSLDYASASAAPDWLDQAKMASLGFNVSPAQGGKDNYRWLNRQLGKEVLLVLEQEGEAYRQALQRTRDKAAEQDAKLKAQPDTEEVKRKAKQLHDEVRHEEQESSRLFAIDAGLSQAALRAKYPDRSRYAIVRGQVRPWSTDVQGKIVGYIDRLTIAGINVPYELRSIFERGASGQADAQPPFAASVAFGQRLEPWLLAISVGAK